MVTPVPSDAVSVKDYKHMEYQELRAVSTDTGPFHFLGGATFLHNDFTGNTLVTVATPLYTAPLTHVNTYVKDESVYAQVGYDFTENLNPRSPAAISTRPTTPVSSSRSYRTRRPPNRKVCRGDLSYALDHGTVYGIRPGLQGGRRESGGLASSFPSRMRERVRTRTGGYL